MNWRAGLFVLIAGCSQSQASPQTKPAPAPAPAASPVPAPERDPDWIPAEFKKGLSRWKDTGVYVDGKPVAFLSFGELPITLEPVWVEEEASIPFKKGHKGPRVKIVKQRHYRFTDYLRALGVDLAEVKELHVYGPKFTGTIIVGGDELRKKGKDFLFRFGGDVAGKAIPRVPQGFGNGKSPDKISTVIVYIKKKPPVLVRNQGLVLDGEVQRDIPYFGEPLRGGVRVYLDDRLATIIKRNQLVWDEAATVIDNVPHYSLAWFLRAEGVGLGKVVEAWIIRDEQRVRKLTADELAQVTFIAGSQKKGEILIGPDKIPAQALALHTSPVGDRLPKLLPHEHFMVEVD
jgi:hypothetical protein